MSAVRDEARREVARQLRITNAAFPALRLTEEAVIAYTEALDMFAADTIAEAFRIARTDAERSHTHHPRPAEVRRYATLYARQQRAYQHTPSDAAPPPYCPECQSRSLFDDGTPFGRFAVAHATSCSQHSHYPPNVRFWVQGATPASFDAQRDEVVEQLNTIPRT